jgi:hypothetical protein
MMGENIDIHSILPSSPTTAEGAEEVAENQKDLKTPKEDAPVLKSIKEETKEEEETTDEGGTLAAAESVEEEFGADNVVAIPVPILVPNPVTTQLPTEVRLASGSVAGREARGLSTEDEKLRKPSISASNKDAVNKAKVAADERKKDTRTNDLITKEERQVGNVAWPLYSYYIKAGGLFWFSGMVFFVVIGQLFQLLANYWLQW